MSSKSDHGSTAHSASGWLTPFRASFLAGLDEQGYAPATVKAYATSINRLQAEIRARGLGASDMDAGILREVEDAILARLSAVSRYQRRPHFRRFAAHLAVEGAIAVPPPPPEPPPGSLERLGEAYGEWLRRHRGLGPITIRYRRWFLKRFLTFRFGTELGDLNSIGADDVRAFLALPPGRPSAGPNLSNKVTGLRCLFRFMFATGLTRADLGLIVPKVAAPSMHGAAVGHVSAGDIGALAEAVRGDTALARRSLAILLLMARLGLRSQEIKALRLADINWPSGTILVRGKGGQHDVMPLPVDVGEAIVDYLLNGRAGPERHLFVSLKAPHRPLGHPVFIRSMLQDAFVKAGLTVPEGGVRCHMLRHSLAVRLLNRGASLEQAGDVLRHRLTRTTTIYARYGPEPLRSLARPWPTQGEDGP